jgi:hypothetical protein
MKYLYGVINLKLLLSNVYKFHQRLLQNPVEYYMNPVDKQLFNIYFNIIIS